MDLRRLRAGEWMAAASGVALLVSLFLPWYRPDGLSGWESLAAIDVLLAFLAASGVLLAIVTAGHSVPAVPTALSALVVIGGLVGVVLVLFRVVAIPDEASGREWGLWLGLAGAVGIVAGAALAMRDERLSTPGRWTDLTGRPGPPPAELDPIAAPGSSYNRER
jgi:hypothetical protein